MLVLAGLPERELRRDGGTGLRVGLFDNIEPVADAADAASGTISTDSPPKSGCCSLTISPLYSIAAHSDSLSSALKIRGRLGEGVSRPSQSALYVLRFRDAVESSSDAGEETTSASEGVVVAVHTLILRIQSLMAASSSLMVVEGAAEHCRKLVVALSSLCFVEKFSRHVVVCCCCGDRNSPEGGVCSNWGGD